MNDSKRYDLKKIIINSKSFLNTEDLRKPIRNFLFKNSKNK